MPFVWMGEIPGDSRTALLGAALGAGLSHGIDALIEQRLRQKLLEDEYQRQLEMKKQLMQEELRQQKELAQFQKQLEIEDPYNKIARLLAIWEVVGGHMPKNLAEEIEKILGTSPYQTIVDIPELPKFAPDITMSLPKREKEPLLSIPELRAQLQIPVERPQIKIREELPYLPTPYEKWQAEQSIAETEQFLKMFDKMLAIERLKEEQRQHDDWMKYNYLKLMSQMQTAMEELNLKTLEKGKDMEWEFTTKNLEAIKNIFEDVTNRPDADIDIAVSHASSIWKTQIARNPEYGQYIAPSIIQFYTGILPKLGVKDGIPEQLNTIITDFNQMSQYYKLMNLNPQPLYEFIKALNIYAPYLSNYIEYSTQNERIYPYLNLSKQPKEEKGGLLHWLKRLLE